MIMDYNRVVKDLNGLDGKEFLENISESFFVEEKGKTPYRPEKKGCFGMYFGDNWYCLRVKDRPQEKNPEKMLDVAVLQDKPGRIVAAKLAVCPGAWHPGPKDRQSD